MQEEKALICFQLISKAGAAKSLCFEALKNAKSGEWKCSRENFEEAKKLFVEAHEYHNQLVQEEASGMLINMTLLLTHAEDILITAEMTREMVEEFVEVYQQLTSLTKEFNMLKDQYAQIK